MNYLFLFSNKDNLDTPDMVAWVEVEAILDTIGLTEENRHWEAYHLGIDCVTWRGLPVVVVVEVVGARTSEVAGKDRVVELLGTYSSFGWNSQL